MRFTSTAHFLRAQERWLEFHDRKTGDIPGILPLVLDMPIRFTKAINKKAREMGVFKHTRGFLRGWELTEAEQARLQAFQDPEVVLKQRPLHLVIEVPTGTKEMPIVDGKKLFTLTTQVGHWSVDAAGAVKVRRYGFPIVPDFGGTAHAYCGSTMEATLGDPLPWTQKPRLEDMLKGYIIKSRIRDASNLLLAQPYSPHLFRQGLLPGPALLLEVLEGKKTSEEARAAWKEHTDAKESKATSAGPWLTSQELPCRLCTDRNNGVEVWRNIKSFQIAHTADDLFKKVLQKGKDLACFKCQHNHLKWNRLRDDVIPCDGCGQIQARCKFDSDARQLWEKCSDDAIICLQCQGKKATRKDVPLIFCNGACQREMPEFYFVEHMLLEWKQQESVLLAKCARCVLRSESPDDATQMTCQGCNVEKRVADFGPVVVKRYLTDGLEKARREPLAMLRLPVPSLQAVCRRRARRQQAALCGAA